jgi:hypothetical protein
MQLFGVHYPGSTIIGLSPEAAFRARTLLSLGETHLIDSALALPMFELARNALLRRHIAVENTDPVVDTRGLASLPPQYLHRLPFVHAHTILYGLDGISRALQRLASTDGAPSGLTRIANDFASDFPELKFVRDSSHHLEDRALGLDQRGKPLDLKPITSGPIQSTTGGVLALDNLEDESLCFTGVDGNYHRVAMSSSSLRKAQSSVQDAINQFDWSGPAQILP